LAKKGWQIVLFFFIFNGIQLDSQKAKSLLVFVHRTCPLTSKRSAFILLLFLRKYQSYVGIDIAIPWFFKLYKPVVYNRLLQRSFFTKEWHGSSEKVGSLIFLQRLSMTFTLSKFACLPKKITCSTLFILNKKWYFFVSTSL
jgi:hypothetical protein